MPTLKARCTDAELRDLPFDLPDSQSDTLVTEQSESESHLLEEREHAQDLDVSCAENGIAVASFSGQ